MVSAAWVVDQPRGPLTSLGSRIQSIQRDLMVCSYHYSHSMVPGGLLVISSTTRFTPFTSFTILLDISSRRS